MVEQKSSFDRTIAAAPAAEAIANLLKTKQGYKISPEVILDAAATSDRPAH